MRLGATLTAMTGMSPSGGRSLTLTSPARLVGRTRSCQARDGTPKPPGRALRRVFAGGDLGNPLRLRRSRTERLASRSASRARPPSIQRRGRTGRESAAAILHEAPPRASLRRQAAKRSRISRGRCPPCLPDCRRPESRPHRARLPRTEPRAGPGILRPARRSWRPTRPQRTVCLRRTLEPVGTAVPGW
jgi:hypothetical protein